MDNTILDTCIIIDYLRGKAEAVQFLEELDTRPYISLLTISELYAGMKNKKEEKACVLLMEYLDVLPINETIAQEGGIICNKYRKSHGTGVVDALLAATAIKYDLILATHNLKHFPMINKIVVPY